MGMGMLGSILALALFVLKLLVALARASGKIAIWQRLYLMPGVSQTQNGRYKDQKMCRKCLLVAEIPNWVCKQTSKKEFRKK